MDNLDVGLLITIFTNCLALLLFVWRLATWKTLLTISIEQNRRDINSLGLSLRDEIKRRDRSILIKLDTVIEYMELKSDFHAPKMKDNATETLITDNLTTGYTYFDTSLNNLGLSVQGTGSINVLVRWDNSIFDPLASLPPLPVELGVTINGDIATFTNYQPIESFYIQFDYQEFDGDSNNSVTICPQRSFDETFNLGYGGYYLFLKGGYGNENSNLQYIRNDDLPVPFDINFENLAPEWNPTFKFALTYQSSEDGLVFNEYQPTTGLSYDSTTRTFTLTTI